MLLVKQNTNTPTAFNSTGLLALPDLIKLHAAAIKTFLSTGKKENKKQSLGRQWPAERELG